MPWHYMPKNHSTALPSRLIFFDTEAKRDLYHDTKLWEQQTLMLGHAIFIRWENGKATRRKTLDFFDIETFWDWAIDKTGQDYTTWILAHNIGYDSRIAGFWNLIDNGEFQFTRPRRSRKTSNQDRRDLGFGDGMCCLEDPPTIIGAEHTSGGRVLLIDTLNWWRTSLRSLGKSIGFQKQDMPESERSVEDWLEYCRRDTQILERSFTGLMSWVKENDLGMFRYSGPGQAMAAFNHRFRKHKILIHDKANVRALERAGYYGGQLEAYRLGVLRGRFYQLDVTSLYPHVMHGNQFPVKLKLWNTRLGWNEEKPPIPPSRSIAEVVLNTPTATFPMRTEQRVVFPIGRFPTVLAGPELQYAVDHGLVHRWGRWATYETEDIFDDFVAFFWKLKQRYEAHNDQVNRTFVKLILNSLYGKFGQLLPSWEMVPNRVADVRWGKWFEKKYGSSATISFQGIGGVTFRKGAPQEHPKSFPAIAAFVTAYARQHMRYLRAIAGKDNVYYQAVDSLIVNDDGYSRLVDAGEVADNQLGRLKLERSADQVELLGLNHYKIADKHCIGGKKKDVDMDDEGYWTEQQFESLRSSLNREPKPEVIVTYVKKHRDDKYRKGHVADDGIVHPYYLGFDTPVDLDTGCVVKGGFTHEVFES